MTNNFNQFKDAVLTTAAQEATKGGIAKAQAFKIMILRMKELEADALKRGDLKAAAIHEKERCKMELTLGRTW